MIEETKHTTSHISKDEYKLKPVLRPIHLWAIAVGLVISGDYIGWNLGLAASGPMGLILATLLITVMYVTFIFSYTELTTSIPNSGGPYAYARRAMGPFAGFIAGFATLIEFVFAPPAIALGIGAYLEFIANKLDYALPTISFPLSETVINLGAMFGMDFPDVYYMSQKVWLALLCYVVFIVINLIGIEAAALFELFVTVLAIGELLIFCGITAPHVKMANIITEPLLPFGVGGIFSSIPFAIWFYLAIEGVAMSAEETANPKKDIPVAYISGIITLVILALGTAFCTMGVIPWQQLAGIDKPLPEAVAAALPAGHWITKMIAVVGVFGLIASFHGIIIGYSRQTFALARARYLPHFLAKISKRTKVPYMALIVPGIIGAIACLTAYTDAIITISVIGAIILYIISLISLFVLRKKEPDMERPYKAPFYPVFPAIALIISVISMISIIYYNLKLFEITMAIFAVGCAYYFTAVKDIVEHETDLLSVADFETLRSTGELPRTGDLPLAEELP
jgi:ethanolamine permease